MKKKKSIRSMEDALKVSGIKVINPCEESKYVKVIKGKPWYEQVLALNKTRA